MTGSPVFDDDAQARAAFDGTAQSVPNFSRDSWNVSGWSDVECDGALEGNFCKELLARDPNKRPSCRRLLKRYEELTATRAYGALQLSDQITQGLGAVLDQGAQDHARVLASLDNIQATLEMTLTTVLGVLNAKDSVVPRLFLILPTSTKQGWFTQKMSIVFFDEYDMKPVKYDKSDSLDFSILSSRLQGMAEGVSSFWRKYGIAVEFAAVLMSLAAKVLAGVHMGSFLPSAFLDKVEGYAEPGMFMKSYLEGIRESAGSQHALSTVLEALPLDEPDASAKVTDAILRAAPVVNAELVGQDDGAQGEAEAQPQPAPELIGQAYAALGRFLMSSHVNFEPGKLDMVKLPGKDGSIHWVSRKNKEKWLVENGLPVNTAPIETTVTAIEVESNNEARKMPSGEAADSIAANALHAEESTSHVSNGAADTAASELQARQQVADIGGGGGAAAEEVPLHLQVATVVEVESGASGGGSGGGATAKEVPMPTTPQDKPSFAGFLEKRGHFLNTGYKKRYFTLLDKADGSWVMSYYKDSALKGSFVLGGDATIVPGPLNDEFQIK